MIGEKIATLLCRGGNDFMPKFHNISRDEITQEITEGDIVLILENGNPYKSTAIKMSLTYT